MIHRDLLDGGTSFLDGASTFMAIQDCETWEDVAIESAREMFVPTSFGLAVLAGKTIHDWVDALPPELTEEPDADAEDDSSWSVLSRPS